MIFSSYGKGIQSSYRTTSENSMNANEHIKFTHVIENKKIPFLDVLVQIEGDEIKTNVYTKSTDRNNYLHFKSFHQASLKKHLPFSQFISLKRITSNVTETSEIIENHAAKFLKRGYPRAIVEESICKVNTLERSSLLTSQKTDTQQPIVCTLKFSTQADNIKNIIKKHWRMITTEPELQSISNHKQHFQISKICESQRNVDEEKNTSKGKHSQRDT